METFDSNRCRIYHGGIPRGAILRTPGQEVVQGLAENRDSGPIGGVRSTSQTRKGAELVLAIVKAYPLLQSSDETVRTVHSRLDADYSEGIYSLGIEEIRRWFRHEKCNLSDAGNERRGSLLHS